MCDRDGLVNGTRLRLLKKHPHVLEVMISSGSHSKEKAFIPRITLLTSNAKDAHYNLRRRQFPVRLAFAMTINKSQGQTINRVSLMLLTPVFTHGQLYVATSRTRNHENLQIYIPKSIANESNSMLKITTYFIYILNIYYVLKISDRNNPKCGF